MKNQEISGRLLLWHHAVSEAQRLLKTAKRARDSAENNLPEEGVDRPFPNYAECWSIYYDCINLAAVYFCQLYHSGYEDKDRAASNVEKFRKDHLDAILKQVFPTSVEEAKYDELIKKVKTLRNGMLGHADAKIFEIDHGITVTSMHDTQKLIIDIDIDYWMSFIDKFGKEILNYNNRIKS